MKAISLLAGLLIISVMTFAAPHTPMYHDHHPYRHYYKHRSSYRQYHHRSYQRHYHNRHHHNHYQGRRGHHVPHARSHNAV